MAPAAPCLHLLDPHAHHCGTRSSTFRSCPKSSQAPHLSPPSSPEKSCADNFFALTLTHFVLTLDQPASQLANL